MSALRSAPVGSSTVERFSSVCRAWFMSILSRWRPRCGSAGSCSDLQRPRWRCRGCATAAPREPGQRREDDALQPPGRERSLYLVLELLGEQGQVERPRNATHHRAALLGEADGGLEELLHLQSRAHLDADERVTVADVREVVLPAGGDDDHFAGSRDDPLAAHPEAHRALDDLEALLLLRVDVLATRDPPVRGKLEVDREQLAVRFRRCLAERDALAACRVLECLSSVNHTSSLAR